MLHTPPVSLLPAIGLCVLAVTAQFTGCVSVHLHIDPKPFYQITENVQMLGLHPLSRTQSTMLDYSSSVGMAGFPKRNNRVSSYQVCPISLEF